MNSSVTEPINPNSPARRDFYKKSHDAPNPSRYQNLQDQQLRIPPYRLFRHARKRQTIPTRITGDKKRKDQISGSNLKNHVWIPLDKGSFRIKIGFWRIQTSQRKSGAMIFPQRLSKPAEKEWERRLQRIKKRFHSLPPPAFAFIITGRKQRPAGNIFPMTEIFDWL